MSRFDSFFTRSLQALSMQGTARSLRPIEPLPGGRALLDGREFVNFSSNDYLGLSHHPALIARAREWTARWGTGAGASRLVTGTLDACQMIEAKIAALKGTESALILASGWQANASALPALFQRAALGEEPLVFTDRLNHASLHQGCQAAGVRQIRFRHNDLNHLETLLKTHQDKPGKRFIVTESVFSMDGDRTDVVALADLAERFDAFIYLDEAHATGVLGPKGAGLSGLVPGRIDAVMGTFSKALGGFGGYIAGSKVLCDHLVNHASGFIFATALPPSVLGAIDAAVDLFPSLEDERRKLAANAQRVRSGFAAIGYNSGQSTTQIVPALIGDAVHALTVSRKLQDAGILAVAIRPPTVPAGTSRIRFALSAAHDPADIDRLMTTMSMIATTASA